MDLFRLLINSAVNLEILPPPPPFPDIEKREQELKEHDREDRVKELKLKEIRKKALKEEREKKQVKENKKREKLKAKEDTLKKKEEVKERNKDLLKKSYKLAKDKSFEFFNKTGFLKTEEVVLCFRKKRAAVLNFVEGFKKLVVGSRRVVFNRQQLCHLPMNSFSHSFC